MARTMTTTMRMTITITITITTMTIKGQKRRTGPCLTITPCNGGHVIHTGLVAGEDHSFNQDDLYDYISIVVITSANHCGFNLVDHCLRSHLSERCLKLPSVGGNCLPFKGAFSLPGSKRFLNFSFIHFHFVCRWSLFFARPWEIFQHHSYSSNLSGLDKRPTWSRWW